MNQPLVVVTLVFLLSLLGAFVLFRLLKSTAVVTRPGSQAGGALAGFLLIFPTLYGGYYQLLRLELELAEAEAQAWTVEGKATRLGERRHGNVTVQLMPPSPVALSEDDGTFILRGVRLTKQQVADRNWPRLRASAEGFLPSTLEPNRVDARQTERLIILGDKIVLHKDVEELPEGVTDLNAQLTELR